MSIKGCCPDISQSKPVRNAGERGLCHSSLPSRASRHAHAVNPSSRLPGPLQDASLTRSSPSQLPATLPCPALPQSLGRATPCSRLYPSALAAPSAHCVSLRCLHFLSVRMDPFIGSSGSMQHEMEPPRLQPSSDASPAGFCFIGPITVLAHLFGLLLLLLLLKSQSPLSTIVAGNLSIMFIYLCLEEFLAHSRCFSPAASMASGPVGPGGSEQGGRARGTGRHLVGSSSQATSDVFILIPRARGSHGGCEEGS